MNPMIIKSTRTSAKNSKKKLAVEGRKRREEGVVSCQILPRSGFLFPVIYKSCANSHPLGTVKGHLLIVKGRHAGADVQLFSAPLPLVVAVVAVVVVDRRRNSSTDNLLRLGKVLWLLLLLLREINWVHVHVHLLAIPHPTTLFSYRSSLVVVLRVPDVLASALVVVVVVHASAVVEQLDRSVGGRKRVAAAGGVGKVPIAVAVAAAQAIDARGLGAVLEAEPFVGSSMGRHD